MTEMLHRRHRLQLDLEADSLDELVRSLMNIATDIDIEAEKGREQREVTSGGYSSGHHLTLVTDEQMTGDRYRAWLDEEFTRRRRRREADLAHLTGRDGAHGAVRRHATSEE